MTFTPITETATFRAWYQRTNDLGSFLDTSVVSDGTSVYGVFEIKNAANTILKVANSFFVNSSLILTTGNVVLAGNISVNTSANLFSVSSNNVLIQPVNGTLVNSAFTVNATVLFSGNTGLGNTTVVGALAVTGNSTFNGTFTANGGSVLTRQILYTGTGALIADTLPNAGYANYAPTGIANCQILSLTPGQDTVLSGITAPSGLGASGARILYIQNISITYKITLSSSNASSTSTNQFKTPSDSPVDISPGAAAAVVYSTDSARWHIITPSAISSAAFTNLSIAGTLGVAGITTLTANLVSAPLYVDHVATRVGIGTATPSYLFHVAGLSYFADILKADSANIAFLNQTGNFSLANGKFSMLQATGNAYFANTIYVNGPSQSYIYSLRVGSETVDGTLGAGAVVGGTISGSTGVFSGNVSTAVLSASNGVFAGALFAANLTVTGSVTGASVGATTGTFTLLGSSNATFTRLGAGGTVDPNAIAKFTGQYFSPLVGAGSSGTTLTLDWTNGNEQYVTMTGNVTFTLSNPVSGGRYVILLNTGAGNFTATWPSTVRWSGGVAPVLTTAAGKLDLFTFMWSATLGLYFGAYSQNYTAS